ncbi:cyclic nucleotide-gated ion channel 1-like [Prunus persica]|nr:cyclic nucleotide-gated ion channel 1-like [Prunus persica]
MAGQHPEDGDSIVFLSTTPGAFNTENANPTSQSGGLGPKKKWETKLLSASLWNKIIVISCVIGVSLDPLFFYIPFIDKEKKCLGMDKKLRNVALILRFLTDITFLVHIGYQTWEAGNKAYKGEDWQQTLKYNEIIPFAKRFAGYLSWLSFLTDLLAVLPVPQILVVVLFFKIKGPEYLGHRKVLNLFLLSQYLPRIFRIILSAKKLTKTGIWVKAIFNFFLYIIASHVLGAFWYFFSIQRETSCWHRACTNTTDYTGCMSTFYCDDRSTTLRNITFFNEHCGVEFPGDKQPFNYGIFLDSLKNDGNTGNIDFPTKLCFSFWWGLRNLSNFGTNLTTSNYVWENFFAILISVTGVLLFVYLIGNVQTFIQLTTTKSEEIRQKIKKREQVWGTWMEENRVPEDLKKEIMKNIHKKLGKDKDANLENLFNVLPWNTKKFLKRRLFFDILSEVKLLKDMDHKVLNMICDHATPVTFPEDKIIFQSGHPLDRMLFILEGTASTSIPTKQLVRGQTYGEELLMWASPNYKPRVNKLPTSTEIVKSRTKLEGFALSATDLVKVASKYRRLWNLNNDP